MKECIHEQNISLWGLLELAPEASRLPRVQCKNPKTFHVPEHQSKDFNPNSPT